MIEAALVVCDSGLQDCSFVTALEPKRLKISLPFDGDASKAVTEQTLKKANTLGTITVRLS